MRRSSYDRVEQCEYWNEGTNTQNATQTIFIYVLDQFHEEGKIVLECIKFGAGFSWRGGGGGLIGRQMFL